MSEPRHLLRQRPRGGRRTLACGRDVARPALAFDYDDQGAIAAELAATSTPRQSVHHDQDSGRRAPPHGDPEIRCGR